MTLALAAALFASFGLCWLLIASLRAHGLGTILDVVERIKARRARPT